MDWGQKAPKKLQLIRENFFGKATIQILWSDLTILGAENWGEMSILGADFVNIPNLPASGPKDDNFNTFSGPITTHKGLFSAPICKHTDCTFFGSEK